MDKSTSPLWCSICNRPVDHAAAHGVNRGLTTVLLGQALLDWAPLEERSHSPGANFAVAQELAILNRAILNLAWELVLTTEEGQRKLDEQVAAIVRQYIPE